MSSSSSPPTYAAIDLGSNSFRLLICRPAGKRLITLCKELVTVRLSEGMAGHETPFISPEASERGRTALHFFRRRLEVFQVTSFRVCATEAIRIAANRDAFLREASAILAASIDVLQGAQEAALSFLGAGMILTHPGLSPVVADVGGAVLKLLTKKGKSSSR